MKKHSDFIRVSQRELRPQNPIPFTSSQVSYFRGFAVCFVNHSSLSRTLGFQGTHQVDSSSTRLSVNGRVGYQGESKFRPASFPHTPERQCPMVFLRMLGELRQISFCICLAFREMQNPKLSIPGLSFGLARIHKFQKSDAWSVVPAPGLINPSPAVFTGSLPPTRSPIWNYLVNYLWFTHLTEASGSVRRHSVPGSLMLPRNTGLEYRGCSGALGPQANKGQSNFEPSMSDSGSYQLCNERAVCMFYSEDNQDLWQEVLWGCVLLPQQAKIEKNNSGQRGKGSGQHEKKEAECSGMQPRAGEVVS